jgi:hypothetical protein
MEAYTDYPIVELGDIPNEEAPVRPCTVLGWDDNKYAFVEVGGVRTTFKVGYIYQREGRWGAVPAIDFQQLPVLSFEEMYPED